MKEELERTERLIGEEAIKKIQRAKVAIFGIGGVGSFVVEGLVRAGIQKFILIDSDTISRSNLNRQIHATQNTIGQDKVEVMKKRILEINPEAQVEAKKIFFMPETKERILDSSIQYIVDAVDTVTAKIEIICEANKLGIPVISAMGTGNKLNPGLFEITDIYKTSVCPLAKVMRKELKAREISKLKVIYSKEEPIRTKKLEEKKPIPGSISFVPSVAGLMIAGEVIKDIIKEN
ncbi:MAG TPA: tRNA threonylcarbamoyladenosine dehydratase [Candidatus Merdicola faecigallinarum]|mgnify:CR=1 FL=1|uniref:tRNA threonylcarbamoyladenosine dehydratase n=1 Tax=Candidatus Merdicola faecigallinarum TaxID=2840862 RepID=A0A9D1M2M3_9FIRM|nr:tRNA threonylcarbamoyladenosine dehydratase [Candidatus Merdicola faecigallinarum]